MSLKSPITLPAMLLVVRFASGFPQDIYRSENRWIEEGDINIGVILSIHSSNSLFNCTLGIQGIRNVQNVEALSFAVRQINSDDKILPNLTLGFVVLDDCESPSIALARAIQFMPSDIRTKGLDVPFAVQASEELRTFYDVVGVIGTYTSKLSIVVANVLNLFELPQISHTATSNILSDKSKFPYFFRMVPPDKYQVKAIASLFSYFNWSHLLIVYSEGTYGREGVKELKNILDEMENYVCIEEAIEIADGSTETDFLDILKRLNAYTDTLVVVAFVEIEHALFISKGVKSAGLVNRFIWIGSDSVSLTLEEHPELCENLPGSMAVHPNALNISTELFSDHLQNLVDTGDTGAFSKNPWIKELQNYHLKNIENNSEHFGTRQTKCLLNDGQYTLKSTFVDSFLIDSVYALAHALDDVVKSQCSPEHVDTMSVAECVSKVGIFEELKKIRFNGLHGELEFNADGDVVTKYELHQCFSRTAHRPAEIKSVGVWDMKGERLRIQENTLLWNDSGVPQSSCPEACTGYTGKIYFYMPRTCCHVCVSCKVNEIVISNATRCEMCPEFHWPDEESRSKCVEIPPFYFGFQNAITIGLCVIAILGALMCFGIIVILVKYREEHVIKCFSIELSGIILLGTLLTYGLAASFLTRPSNWKCYINHVGFSLTYTMIYAPLLVKTNRIYRIFNAGRRTTRKPCLISTSSQVIFSVFFIFCQIAIVIVSTSIEPPEVALHMPRRNEKFVELFCNLPQAGLLSSLSFNLILVVICTFYAFKTRKLPDNYKESRYIAFCVDTTLLIWITFVPTYFTTTRAAAKTTILAISLLLNPSVTVTCLFVPRIYSLYRSLKDLKCSSVGHNYKDFRIVKHVVKRKHSANGLKAMESDSVSCDIKRMSRAMTSHIDLEYRETSDLVLAVTSSQTCLEMARLSNSDVSQEFMDVSQKEIIDKDKEKPRFKLG